MPSDPQTPSAPSPFYVTTPIYYVNARPHIGHSYTTLVADTVARQHRLLGHPTFFLTGTDEHGQKIERSAAAAGIPPQQFADEVSRSFRDLWDRMGITYTGFIRTTEPRHKQGVQHLFEQLQKNGSIYKGTYTGQYCVSDEAYVDGPPGIHCPDCGRPTETVSESNYYFKLSAFQRPLLDLIESDTLRIEPPSRRNEVLSFLRGPLPSPTNVISTEAQRSGETPVSAPAESFGASATTQSDKGNAGPAPELAHTAAGTPYLPGALKDLSISRTSFRWGIPVPNDPDHVIYVWLDALANYMTALGYGSADDQLFQKFWPANLHLVGKEIIRFHCVYWPAFLLALDPSWSTTSATPNNSSVISTEGAAAAERPASSPTNPVISTEALSEQSEPMGAAERPASAPAQTLPLLSFRSAAEESASPSPTTNSVFSTGGAAAVERPASAPAHAPGDPSTTLQPAVAFDPSWVRKMLPRSVVAHGWLLFEESKMSKSRGNIVRTETILDGFGRTYLQGIRDHNAREQKKDPGFHPLPDPTPREQDLFATDVLRYFLLREIPFGQDGSFSFDSMVTRYNADLANSYGNLVSRTLAMLAKYFDGVVPDSDARRDNTDTQTILGAYLNPERVEESGFIVRLPSEATDLVKVFAKDLAHHRFARAFEALWTYIGLLDSELSSQAPWKIPVGISEAQFLPFRSRILYTAAESIRILTALLYPILPFATGKVWEQLGFEKSIEQAAVDGDLRNLEWGGLAPGTRLGPLAPLFPRAPKELAQTMADIESGNPRPTAPSPANDLTGVANDERDAATPATTPFREAPLASAPANIPDQPLAAKAATETKSLSSRPERSAVERPASAPSQTTSVISTEAQRSGETPVFAPAQTNPVISTGGEAGAERPAFAPAQAPSSTHPAAPPRATSQSSNPIAEVAGSAAVTPARPTTPSHVEAEPSGVFAGSAAAAPVTASPLDSSPQITIDDFAKVELRVAQILVCDRIPKADKLLRLEVDLGPDLGRRQILSGIAEWYTPEDLVGRRIVVITNLAPRKMRGLDSHGMLLAASGPSDGPGAGKPVLATFPDSETLPLGARLK